MINTLVLKATVRKHWHLEWMKHEDTAMNYSCEIDTYNGRKTGKCRRNSR